MQYLVGRSKQWCKNRKVDNFLNYKAAVAAFMYILPASSQILPPMLWSMTIVHPSEHYLGTV